MKATTTAAGVIVSLILTGLSATTYPTAAEAQGEWTKCVMVLTDGRQVNVVNGQFADWVCHAEGQACGG